MARQADRLLGEQAESALYIDETAFAKKRECSVCAVKIGHGESVGVVFSIMNSALAEQFQKRWTINSLGGVNALVARWRVLHLMALQRAGMHCWATAPLFFGAKMRCHLGEETSRGIPVFGYSENALTALMIQKIKPGMHVVDVGAHLGYEAILASVLVGESGKVVSFEPQEAIAQHTAINLKPYSQTRLVVSALGDSDGWLEFANLGIEKSAFVGPANTGTAIRVRVPVTTLTAALRGGERPVDFIKVDVEGAEMAVLRGAVSILKQDKPLLVLEAEMPGGPRPRVQEFIEFLAPLGYQAFSFDFDGELKIAPFGELGESHANVCFAQSGHRLLVR